MSLDRLDVDVDGRRVRGVSAGAGRPVLFLHGLGGSARYWGESLAALAGELRGIALDLPGFGSSDRAAEPFSLDGAADTLAGACTALGIERATIVGHSFGAGIAIRLAARHPALASALVLVGPTGLAPVPGSERRRLLLATALYQPLARIPLRWEMPVARSGLSRRALWRYLFARPDEVTPAVAEMLLRGSREARQLRSAARAALDDLVAQDAAALTIPIGAIWGTSDLISGPAERAALAAAVPQAQIRELEGVGHVPLLEAPERFRAALRDLLCALGV